METVSVLNGHSGCNVRVIKDGSRELVRKTSPSAEYNARLEKQMRKQASFCHSWLKSPAVIRYGEDCGLFYFDMEYIKGQTAAEYLKKCDNKRIEAFARKIASSVFDCGAVSDARAAQRFKDKTAALKASLGTSDARLAEAFGVLDSTDWSRIKKSACHGDLTLENIIVSNSGDVYLIDFLDSFYDSYIIDAGKMLQDAIGMWSFRNDIAGSAKAIELYRRAVVGELKRGGEFDLAVRAALLHLLRTLPYSQDAQDRAFVIDSIKSTLEFAK